MLCVKDSRHLLEGQDKIHIAAHGSPHRLQLFRRARSDKDNFYIGLLLNNFAVITTDSNNITRLDGTRNEPLRYEIESDTGEEFEDLNCVKLEFSRKLRFPSPLISL